MARGSSGFFTKFVICLLVIATLYNGWQVYNLKAEIANLQKRGTDRIEVRGRVEASSPASSNLDNAYDHLLRANKYLQKGDTKRTSLEFEKSLLNMRAAGAQASAPARRAIESLQQSMNNTLKVLDNLRNSPK